MPTGANPANTPVNDFRTFARISERLAHPDPRTVVAAIWIGAIVVALGQRAVEALILGRSHDTQLLQSDRWLLAMWALATPIIMRSARWLPVRPPSTLQNAALHLALATAFIVATNAAIRVPLAFPPYSLPTPALVRNLALGLARFYPAALVVYGVLVTLGHRVWPTASPAVTESAAESPAQAPAEAPVERSAQQLPDRVVVRAWNRVSLVPPDEIAWIESDGNYVVVQAAGRTYKGRGRISELESQLDPAAFVRIHRSAIVHVPHVREVQPLSKGDLAVIVDGGKVLRVSRARRAALEAAMQIRV